MKKRVLSILLTLCLLCGIGAVGAFAESTPTKILDLKGEGVTFTPTGYQVEKDGQTQQFDFVGNYILLGEAKWVAFTGENAVYNLTVHEFTIQSQESTTLLLKDNHITLNVAMYGLFFAYGKNAVAGHSEGVSGGKIKVTFHPISRLYWSVQEGTPVGQGVGLENEKGEPLVSAWSDPTYFYVLGTQSPYDHQAAVVKGENGCVYACEHCDILDGVEAPHTLTEGGKFVDADTCERICSVCEQAVEGDHVYAGCRYVDDDICGEYCRYCDQVFAAYNHEIYYEPAEEGHTPYCDYCGHQWEEVLPHTPTYGWENAERCTSVCVDCWKELGESLPHLYNGGEYSSNSADGCAPVCDRCGGYDSSSENLIPHDYSKYVSYDEENCVLVCSRCGYWKEDENGEYTLTPHKFGQPVTVPATDWQEEHTETVCETCQYSIYEYNKEKSIVIEMLQTNNEMGGLAVYRNGELWKHVNNECDEINALPFDQNASYVFKLLNTTAPDTPLTIWMPGLEQPLFASENLAEDGFGMYDTVATYNMADYSELQKALDTVPADMSEYTEASATAVADGVKAITRMLPKTQQATVDSYTKAVKEAVEGLKKRGETDPMHGIVHVRDTSVDIYPENYVVYNSDTWEEIKTVSYEGDYVLFGTKVMDEVGKEDYSKGSFWVCGGANLSVDLANLWSIGLDGVAGIVENSSAKVTLYGNNAIVDGTEYLVDENGQEWYFSEYAGVNVTEGNSITIEGNGSLIALGQDNCAGIGGGSRENAGTITINSGNIFAFSAGDGAGIGGGYKAGAGTITINGGTVYANCLHDDGAGIGGGDDGIGGTVIINGGDVTALSLDDDGSGIGSGDEGHIDSITINGGFIIAGAEDGAAIGGGQEAISYGGKITVNGGVVMPHMNHNETEYFMGNGNSSSKGLDEDNFVQINGGVVITQGTKGIYPLKASKEGSTVTATDIPVPQGKENTSVTIVLEDGSYVTVTPVDGKATVFVDPMAYTLLGDVNKDTKINAKDALMVLRIAVNKLVANEQQTVAGDVNKDTKIDAKDALEILKYSVGKPSVLD